MLTLDVAADLDGFRLTVNHTFPAGGISAVFGPSGSGKSTLLRCIAGFQRCSGRIIFNTEAWLDSDNRLVVPAYRRPVGFVFQDVRLFEHLSVADNLGYAMRRAPQPLRIDLDTVVQTLELEALMPRQTTGLSGGERQRVALGRTLLSQPQLMLLDEPLSALDLARKADLLPYIRSVSETFNIPALFVSHAIDEVAQLAAYTLVLEQGQVQTAGATLDVLEHPALLRLTGRRESGALLNGRVTGYDAKYQLAELRCGGQSLAVPTTQPPLSDTTATLYVRARDVSVATRPPQQTSVRNILRGRLQAIQAGHDSPFAELVIDIGGQLLHARVTRAAVADLGLQENGDIYALIKSVSFDQGEPP